MLVPTRRSSPTVSVPVSTCTSPSLYSVQPWPPPMVTFPLPVLLTNVPRLLNVAWPPPPDTYILNPSALMSNTAPARLFRTGPPFPPISPPVHSPVPALLIWRLPFTDLSALVVKTSVSVTSIVCTPELPSAPLSNTSDRKVGDTSTVTCSPSITAVSVGTAPQLQMAGLLQLPLAMLAHVTAAGAADQRGSSATVLCAGVSGSENEAGRGATLVGALGTNAPDRVCSTSLIETGA